MEMSLNKWWMMCVMSIKLTINICEVLKGLTVRLLFFFNFLWMKSYSKVIVKKNIESEYLAMN